ncbi:MAG: putative metal-binding motif-containing protein [Bacteroidota bacterium]
MAALQAQSYLPSFVDNGTPGVIDYIIPDNVVSIFVEMAGAQGGNTETNCLFKGGKGGGWKFTIYVGYCGSTQLKPGGLLRLVTGERGQSVRIDPNVGGAGGGGGTALLYKSPGSNNWIILAVGGGGGGASFTNNPVLDAILCYGEDGRDAVPTSFGSNGGKGSDNFPAGIGGINGNGGSGSPINTSYGGGGAFSNGTTNGGDQDCSGNLGLPNGGDRASCGVLFRYYGGFGFGSGAAGVAGGGGGGGYSGGGGGGGNQSIPGGGGGGGSICPNVYIGSFFLNEGGGYIMIFCTTGTPTPPLSLASTTLPPRDVAGCSVTQSAGLGLSTGGSQTTISLASFTALGGVINPGGCTLQSISYTDTLEPSNPTRVVNRTYNVTDSGGNMDRCKQVITVKSPGVISTIAPVSQYTCINLTPGIITTSANSQFGITVQWYKGESAIFSEAASIPGANALSYTPAPNNIEGTYYYFCRITDGCGSVTNRVSTVIVTPSASTWHKDSDGDNYNDPNGNVVACASPGAVYKRFGLLGVDCNDNDSNIFPGAPEICDGKDNNCNGTIDENCCSAGNIHYVSQNATGLNNGGSWANAFTSLQSALASTCANVTQIWVAKGTYKPTNTTDRNGAFVMKNNIVIYGGFAGNETQFSARRVIENVTTLSGDIGSIGSNADNSYNVIRNDNNGLNATAVLDGFTITGGNASDGANYQHSRGAGILNRLVSPTIRNCQFVGNSAVEYGGGVFNEQGTPLLINTVLAGNTALFGAGLYNESSTPTLVNCTIAGNLASAAGGAMHTYGNVSPQVRNSILWGNNSGVSNNLATPVFTNSMVQPNSQYLPQDSVFIFKPTPGLGNMGDLRLLPCSPAVNTGNNDLLVSPGPYFDIIGNYRKFNGNTDLGAYERILSYPIVYVDSAATGTNDGTSWENGYTSLDKAIREMNYCDGTEISGTIYLAKGTYVLSGTQTTFLKRINATILGGYPQGGGPRNAITNPVLIKGAVRVLKSLTLDGVKVEQL